MHVLILLVEKNFESILIFPTLIHYQMLMQTFFVLWKENYSSHLKII